MINELKYGETWKIWPSSLSLSLYSTFKNKMIFFHEMKKKYESLLKCLSDSVNFHIIGYLFCPKFVLILQFSENFCNFLQISEFNF